MVWFKFWKTKLFLGKIICVFLQCQQEIDAYKCSPDTTRTICSFFQNKSLLLYIFYFLLRMERTGTKDSYTLFPSSVGLTFIFLTLLTFLCLSTYFILCLRNSRASIFIANLSISSPVQIHWSCLSILQYSC